MSTNSTSDSARMAHHFESQMRVKRNVLLRHRANNAGLAARLCALDHKLR